MQEVMQVAILPVYGEWTALHRQACNPQDCGNMKEEDVGSMQEVGSDSERDSDTL